MTQPYSRRSFIKTGSLASVAALTFPHILRANSGTRSPNERLNVAVIGVGGVGGSSVIGVKGENIVAFCDVDQKRAAAGFKGLEKKVPEEMDRFQKIPMFDDYRRMFDRLGNQIDAVTISIPDHAHFPAAMTAMGLGKHVYVQKPLTHTIWEARRLAEFAREKRVVTQMGNQGHAGDGCRILREWLQAGVLGEVREVHSWTDRPGKFWPYVASLPDHLKGAPPIPTTLNWDAWLCASKAREYDPAYVPHHWRGWWDFGTGAFGDVACHIMDGAYWALDLGSPTSVEAMASGASDFACPRSAVVTMNFPARGAMPPVKYVWSDGGLMPSLPPELELGRSLSPEAGTLIFGSKAVALASFYYETVTIIPEKRMLELQPTLPPATIPRVVGGPFGEWIRGCKGGPRPGSNFDYSGPFTETVLLANVAIRAQRRIEWDHAAMKVTNLPDANRFLTREYRPGWF